MAMTIEPLGETMAAEVTGVDLAVPVDNEVARAFYQALVEHMVLCFRDQDLTPAQYGQPKRSQAEYIRERTGDGRI